MSSSTDKLDAESHILLDEPLLRLPHELLRKTFKTAQKHYERETTTLTNTLTTTVRLSPAAPTSATLASLDTLISKLTAYKRRLAALHNEEQSVHTSTRARLTHLKQLYTIPTLSSPEYTAWSRTRLDRLIVDYLVRTSHPATATALAHSRNIEPLVDIRVFTAAAAIASSLANGNPAPALAWCADHKQALRKQKSPLEFQLRLQQFVELIRSGDARGALEHSRKHLSAAQGQPEQLVAVQRAAGLLVSPGRYEEIAGQKRWAELAGEFMSTHHGLYGIPLQPLVQVVLAAGLSALKTPSCGVAGAGGGRVRGVCPICSMELRELARGVPWAHHGRSEVEGEPVVLPNGRVHGRERVEGLARRLGLVGRVRDPETGEEWAVDQKGRGVGGEEVVRKVYIM